MHSMAFRADEQANVGREGAIDYLITKNIPTSDRQRSLAVFDEILDKYGPVVRSYPSWHPLMTANGNKRDLGRYPQTSPNVDSGYAGLDHTIYLRNAFITCPYSGAKNVIDAVNSLKGHADATISAEELDVPLYMPNATPVLVKCEWHEDMDLDGTIPKQVAVGLLLEQEVPCWRWAQVAETWEDMRHYILGSPRGSKSSLFVNQETGNALKHVYMMLIKTGIFGPIRE
jgi:hypothetical protein